MIELMKRLILNIGNDVEESDAQPKNIGVSADVQEAPKKRRTDNEGFVRLSALNSPNEDKDLEPEKHEKMLKLAHLIYRSNPIAHRSIDIRTNLITSEGFEFVAKGKNEKKRKRLQDFLDKMRKVNRWDKQLDTRVRELLLSGELTMVASSKLPKDGVVRLSSIYSENIDKVIMNPADNEELTHIVFKPHMHVDGARRENLLFNYGNTDNPNSITKATFLPELYYTKKSEKDRTFQIVNRHASNIVDGEVFFLNINRTIGSTRGLSDLAPVLDWLTIHNKIVQVEYERFLFSRSFVYEVTVDGGPKDIRKAEERYRKPPKAGSVLVHPTEESWSTVQPQLTLFDSVGLMKYIQILTLGGLGIPEHYYLEAGSVNKSAAAKLDSPLFQWSRQMKNILIDFFELIIDYSIMRARDQLFADFNDEDLKYEVISRDPDRGAYDELGSMLLKLGEAMEMFEKNCWAKEDETRRLMQQVTKALGLGEFQALSEEEVKTLRDKKQEEQLQRFAKSKDFSGDEKEEYNNGEETEKFDKGKQERDEQKEKEQSRKDTRRN